MLIILLSITIDACSKAKEPEPSSGFDKITWNEIKEKESLMGDEEIQTSGVNGIGWKKGEIYFYRTRSGMFGKFLIGSIEPEVNYRFTITAVTFNFDGTLHKKVENLKIRGTYGANLEDMIEASIMEDMDFYWVRQNQSTTIFTPTNGAAFIVFRMD